MDQVFQKLDWNSIKEQLEHGRIPYGEILSLKKVFENKEAKKLLLNNKLKDHTYKIPSSVAFKIKFQ